MPESSEEDSKSSASSKSRSKSGKRKHENYHVDTGKIPQRKRKVNAAKRSAQRQKEVCKKKQFNSKTLLQGEFEGKDISMGSEQDPHDVTNLFEFNNRLSTPVELRKTVPITCTTENSFVPYENDLGIVKLPIKKQLSCDNTTPIKVTTGNAPNKLKVTDNSRVCLCFYL